MTRQDFILLIEGSQRPFRRFLTALCCGDSQLADDLAQEAYMKAWLAIDSLSDRGAFNAWLRRIGYNTFLSHRRALHPTEDVTEARDIAGSETGDSSFRYQDLYQALDRIPPRERTSIVLYYMEGYSTREIAGITDTTENNVRQQLARGRSHLKSLLTPQ